MGLIKAVDRFDHTRGYRFSTYATYWVLQAVRRAVADKARTIRIPAYLYDDLCRFNKTYSDLIVVLGSTPTIEDVASEMGISLEMAAKLYKLNVDTISMNQLVNDDSDSEELESFIASPDKTPEELVMDDVLSDEVRNLLETSRLTLREKDVLMLRNGFGDKEEMTLEAIGQKYGITRERVRQIEAKALLKIRKNKRTREFY